MSSEQLSLSLMDHAGPAIAVLGVLGILAYFLRNKDAISRLVSIRRGQDSQVRLRLLDRVNLAPQSSICLIEVGDRRWLVSSSASGISMLESLGPTAEAATSSASVEEKPVTEKPKATSAKDALERFERIRRAAASVRISAAPAPRIALTGAAYLE